MLLYGAYGYLGHLRWHSIRHKPRAISATYGGAQYARVASLCARPSHGYAMQRPARIRSAFYLLILTFLQSFIVAPSQYTHQPPYGYRILKIAVFLKKYTFICDSIYIYQIQYTSTKFNIHHLYNLSFNRPPFFVKIHTNFHNTLRPRLIWYCIPLFADLLQNCPYSSTMSNAWQYCASGRISASGQDSTT